jgi:hypothetical protein
MRFGGLIGGNWELGVGSWELGSYGRSEIQYIIEEVFGIWYSVFVGWVEEERHPNPLTP